MTAALWQARTSLVVHTARLFAYEGLGALNITRMSGGPAGEPFAPSWGILRPALAEFSRARQMRSRHGTQSLPVSRDWWGDAVEVERRAWATYVPLYIAEQEQSFDDFRPAWEGLLGREFVVLQCYCADPQHCHRTLLARDILARLGADYRGEIAPASKPARQGSLF